ncbi:hemolysin III family protein [Enterovirga sp.]|jgi:hemolysin III|uniref:PAQR family membrane homeostasis protein TrhA n=1 Tax=Enterovirga sp. TaxID=2026350 RepID=UPI00261DC081|nr:hemolysin III family protein [Enterovirga sp.]MDB5592791.1 DNA-binding protein [Enterovirga sp.]
MLDADGRPMHVSWRYTRAEIVADAVVHVLGIVFAVAGAIALVVLAADDGTPGQIAAVTIYAVCLICLKAASAAYNMWPVSRTKWLLRRFDHACIFLLIAATYTPFMTRFPFGPVAVALFVGVWSVAIFGATLKLTLPGRFDRLSIALCLLLGASGGIVWDSVSAALPPDTLKLILLGGFIYAGGVVFHVWQSLRFQNVAWHACVLAASAVFYVAILNGVVLA